MAELLQGTKRTHYCGQLREEHIGQIVTLMGWVQKKRNLGALVFVDLRDREGVAQVMFDPDLSRQAFEKAEKTRGEFVLAVTGEVRRRESINENIPTGYVEVFAKELKVISESEVPPIHINDDDKAGEQLRLKYRYLDLRKPKMQKRLRFRYKVSKIIRDFLDEEGFIDLETPILTKPTPEGARDYLVPSRVQQGKFFALPQSPQLFKQLFMVSGFDKYFQIVKCFRDEDLRADRQPEFTQVDIEMSFVEEEDVLAMNERLIQRVFKDALDYDVQLPLPRMPYKEAMERFGSDKPDTRFGFELKSLNEVLAKSEFQVFSGAISSGGMVKAINANGRAGEVSKKKIKNLEKFVKTYGAKGLAWMKLTEEGIESPVAKFLSEDEINGIIETMEAKTGDMIFIVADKSSVVYDSLGALRVELAKQFDMLDDSQFNLLWVTEFPLFEYDEDEGRYYAMHHPFTSPMDEDIDKVESDPGNARAKAYDIVLNGVELGGGSIRIHDAGLQKTMFKALGLSEEETNEKFGFLLEAFKYGTPPHGGVAFGLDRFVMLLIGAENIREVIAFPKTQDAKCLMTDAPSLADPNQLVELGIELVAKEDE
ncbi:aspartate--tRNA ligase [Fusibacter sp. JL216-2]|uniref:aspartate--tRNA ligase n=1 Tax=Fusibacter sp. JL216-2 TaxID=3071453 RepID=UPI003D32C84F